MVLPHKVQMPSVPVITPVPMKIGPRIPSGLNQCKTLLSHDGCSRKDRNVSVFKVSKYAEGIKETLDALITPVAQNEFTYSLARNLVKDTGRKCSGVDRHAPELMEICLLR